MAGGLAADNNPKPGGHPRPGATIEVRSRFDGSWCRGFQVAEVVATDTGVAFRVRRLSDGATLPALFPPDDVFAARDREQDF
jgi:hypothetical protein